MCQIQHPDKWYEAMGEIAGYRGRNQHFTPGTHRYWQCNCETVMYAVPFSGIADMSMKEALAARVIETQTQEETKPLKDCKGEVVINYSDGKGYLANEMCDMCGAVRPKNICVRLNVPARAWVHFRSRSTISAQAQMLGKVPKWRGTNRSCPGSIS